MTTTVILAIEKLSLAGLTQLVKSSLDNLEQQEVTSADPIVSNLIERLKTNLPNLQASLKQKRGSQVTKDIIKAQKMRQDDFNALLNALRSYRKTRQAEKAVAYQELSTVTTTYKDLNRVNMEDSMALFASLLTKLEAEKLIQAAQTLGLTEFVANLKDSQSKLYQLYLQRSQEVTNKVSIDSRAVRQTITADYKLLYKHLTTKLTFNPNDADKIILQLLNDIRKDHADNVKRKKGKVKIVSAEDNQIASGE